MPLHDDVNAARNAVRALERAVAALAGHFGDSVDVTRLRTDVERAAQDLELLVGPQTSEPAAPRLQVIDDTAYPQDFWMDAEDEGLGGGR